MDYVLLWRMALEFLCIMVIMRMTHMIILYRKSLVDLRYNQPSKPFAFHPKYSARFLAIVYAIVMGITLGTLWNIWKQPPFNPFVLWQGLCMLALYFNFGKMLSTYNPPPYETGLSPASQDED